MIKKIFMSVGVLCVTVAVVVSLGLYWLVVVNPGPSVSPSYLQNVLTVESPVFYKNGTDKIGVFFENAHRQYLPYRRIPKDFVNSIVAAEDQNFFHHHGVDFFGLFRAMIRNVKAGRVVQGGSTITQQTAKNLYERKDRSLKEKLKELIAAWRLEYHYSKEKILEFYTNQFYVSGNGHGLGVAANYYFNKKAEDLALIECAFIAGSVKRPNFYNPFLKKSTQEVLKAQKHAQQRTDYVLSRMFQLGMINEKEYRANKGREIPFRQGQMSYALNTIMDLVKEALAEPEVEAALVDHGIDNVATSGIKIFTTIEKQLQERSFTALREELSRLAIRLEGYDHRAIQAQYVSLAEKYKREAATGAFLFGRVQAVHKGKDPSLEVVFPMSRHGGAYQPHGIIGSTSLKETLVSLAKYRRQRWSEPVSGEMDSFLDGFKVGDLIYVQVGAFVEDEGYYRLNVRRYPEIQGGVVVVKEGKIQAMVGGNENRFYNRVMARRLMGSTAKPLLYTAALQLRWNPLDLLNNRRDAFVYQGQTYFPRPDHHSPYAGVSINWAGVKSENVASVWLLYNLCSRLSKGEFRRLVEGVGLARGAEESYNQYVERIRDQHGILVRQEQRSQLAFFQAVDEIEPDLLFAGKDEEFRLLRHFHYRLDGESVEEDDLSSEAELRRQILKHTYVHIARIGGSLRWLRSVVEGKTVDAPSFAAGEGGGKSYHLYYNALSESYAYGENPPEGFWIMIDPLDLYAGRGAAKNVPWDEVRLDGLISLSTFEMLQEAVTRKLRALNHKKGYSSEVLYEIKDFQVLVGLRYLIGLCREMGIKSPLEPVLSFPLGSNVISLLDLARAYETIGTGISTSVGRFDSGDGPMIIDRIENRAGTVVYRPLVRKQKVVDPEVSLEVSSILGNVVSYGTGRYAREHVRVEGSQEQSEEQQEVGTISFPLFGKTGTANYYRNAAFSGFVPSARPGTNGVQVDAGFFVTTYVGYDDNKPMVRKTTRIAGSSGALPVWTKVAQAIIDREGLSRLQEDEERNGAGLRPSLLLPPLGQIILDSEDIEKVAKEEERDLVYLQEADARVYGKDVLTFGRWDEDGTLHLKRNFRPYWEQN